MQPENELEAERRLVQSLSHLKSQQGEAPDLWPAIAQKINQLEQQSRQAPGESKLSSRWRSLAAMWVVSSCLLLFSGWQAWQSTSEDREQPLASKAQAHSFEVEAERAAKSWQLARTALIAQLKTRQDRLSKETLENIESNLMIIDQANEALTDLLKKQPDNARLRHLLQQNRERELVFLQQLNRALNAS